MNWIKYVEKSLFRLTHGNESRENIIKYPYKIIAFTLIIHVPSNILYVFLNINFSLCNQNSLIIFSFQPTRFPKMPLIHTLTKQ